MGFIFRVPAPPPDSGYFAGGQPGGAAISKFTFVTETSALLSATLSLARQSPTGVNSPIRGYIAGGHSTARSTEIDGVQFDTDAAINPAATLSSARLGCAGIQSGSL